MHMADALVSPAVGGTLWMISGGLIAYCGRQVKRALRDDLVPLMGVLGAFVFAAQMINFTIPGTGSSGHLGGGLILAALLGPHAAFLVVASVLTIQALFFADGGLLALGCNIFNLGFFPAFVAYPLVYKAIARTHFAGPRAWTAAVAASLVALQLGAFSVVVQTVASGISELPFRGFVLMMLPIHLAIGLVEGLATAVVVAFVARARPEVLPSAGPASQRGTLRPVLAGLAVAALLTGGVASWFASTHPDGLEWSMAKVSGREELAPPGSSLHASLASVQEKTAVLPDYGFKAAESGETADAEGHGEAADPWPAPSAGTSVSGLVGGLLTLAVAALLGLLFRGRPRAAVERGQA